ncbi:MAG: hypothetical protein R3336_09030 [Phycisphaeraceae bacterium]|nr:hypothetical protein [Phycisphaeraceae bacterium]
MTGAILLLIVAGIGLAQVVSSPRQVTLLWLRLGGLIAIGLLAVAVVVVGLGGWGSNLYLVGAVAVIAVGQLMTVQLGWKVTQRILAGGTFLVGATLGGLWMARVAMPELQPSAAAVAMVPTAMAAAGLLGGSLMTMLLGHAYLTAGGQMTQAPFRRLVVMLLVVLGVRAGLSVICGLWPWWQAEPTGGMAQMWENVMLVARYAVGLGVPAVFLWMAWDCGRRVSNQSATGILYVTSVLIIIGEGIALGLLGPKGFVF